MKKTIDAYMGNEIGDTGDFDEDDDDDNSALLSAVADDVLSQLSRENNIFTEQDDNDTDKEEEDSDSNYDKCQDDGVLEQMKSRNKR